METDEPIDKWSPDTLISAMSFMVLGACVGETVCFTWLSRDDFFTPEAVGFLSAAGVFIILPAVLFHFINKKLCFEKRGGPPCMEQQGRQKHYRETSRDHESLEKLPSKRGGISLVHAPFKKPNRWDSHYGSLQTIAQANGSYWTNEDLQPLDQLPPIAEEEGEPSVRTEGHEHNLDLGGSLKHHNGKASFAVNSSREDEEQTAPSGSDDEVINEFEISVSCSQSFLSEVCEKATPAGVEHRPKFSCLLSSHEEYGAKVSECECKDLDGLSQLSYQDNLSCHEDDHVSVDSRTTIDIRGAGQHKGPRMETSIADGVSQQATEVHLEMAFEVNDATDSSSAWSPEEGDEVNSVPAHHGAHEPICKCGDLDVIFNYKASSQKLVVTILEARDIPDKDRSGVNIWQVHTVLMPSKKQRGKTSVQRGPIPMFKDKITFSKLEPEELSSHAIRFRLYAVQKVIGEKMMGEQLFYLSNISQEGETKVTLVLEPRSNLSSADSQLSLSAISHSDSASSTQSLSHGGVPELLVGLLYNATTGRLSVEMIKGSHFRNLAINRPPDTYGKLCLLNSVGQEMSRCKTSIRRGQPNPVYKETFIFQVALFQLSDVTLMISIYNRRSMKRKEMIGWISMGQNSSGEEEQSHWQEMKESKGTQVCRWHTLLES